MFFMLARVSHAVPPLLIHSATEGTYAFDANKIMYNNFPETRKVFTLVTLISSVVPNVSIVEPGSAAANYTRDLSLFLNKTFAPGRYWRPEEFGAVVQMTLVDGYFLEQVPEIAQKFINADKSSTFVAIQYRKIETQDEAISDIVKTMRMIVDNFAPPPGVTAGVTGNDAIFYDVNLTIETDMVTMDSIVMPLALLVLAYAIRSWRTLILPILVIAISIFAAFACMYGVAINLLQVASFTPPVMMSLTIAMSIDYQARCAATFFLHAASFFVWVCCLFVVLRFVCERRRFFVYFPLLRCRMRCATYFFFPPHGVPVIPLNSCCTHACMRMQLFLLTRYREELMRERVLNAASGISQPLVEQNRKAVRLMLQHAGRVVIVSGSTLVMTLLGLCFFPLDMLISCGIGASIAVTIAIVVSLSLTPALLLTFPGFFSVFGPPKWMSSLVARCCGRCGGGKKCCRPENEEEEDQRRHLLLASAASDANGGAGAAPLPVSAAATYASGSGRYDADYTAAAAASSASSSYGSGGGGMDGVAFTAPSAAQQPHKHSLCFRCGECTTGLKMSIVIIAVVVGLAVPVSIQVYNSEEGTGETNHKQQGQEANKANLFL